MDEKRIAEIREHCEKVINAFQQILDQLEQAREELSKRSVCKGCPIPEGMTDEEVTFAIEQVKSGAGQWIPVTERLPESGVHVLLCCEVRPSGSKYVCDGYYAAKLSIDAGHSCDLDTDYDEEKDTFYLPEGFYEVIKNWDDYSSIVIEDFVTHWMPLPAPPESGKGADDIF